MRYLETYPYTLEYWLLGLLSYWTVLFNGANEDDEQVLIAIKSSHNLNYVIKASN